MSHSTTPTTTAAGSQLPQLVVSWLVVGIPLAYGVWQTLLKAAKLFTG